VRTSLRHFLPAFACALAVAGVSAGSASARPGYTFTPIAFPGHEMATWPWNVNTEGAVAVPGVSAGSASARPGYTFSPIAFPGHQTATWPWNVNTEGAVIGEYWTGAPNDAQNGSQALGFVDYFGHYVTIKEPNMAPYDEMNAMELTQSGEVIGGYYYGTTVSTAGSNGRIYIDHHGHFTNLNDPNADTSCATGQCGTWPLSANFSGEVVGAYYTADGAQHGFIYQRRHFTTVDYPGKAGTNLYDVSDQGLISGTSWDQSGNQINFLYSAEDGFVTFPDLTAEQAPGILPNTPVPPSGYGDATELFGVNDHGLRSGQYAAAPTTEQCGNNVGADVDGFIERHGSVTDLTVPSTTITLPDINNPSTCIMELWGANDAGQVAGQYWDTSTQYGESYGFVVNTGF
jgi:hypothetical protein